MSDNAQVPPPLPLTLQELTDVRRSICVAAECNAALVWLERATLERISAQAPGRFKQCEIWSIGRVAQDDKLPIETRSVAIALDHIEAEMAATITARREDWETLSDLARRTLDAFARRSERATSSVLTDLDGEPIDARLVSDPDSFAEQLEQAIDCEMNGDGY